MDGTRIRKRLPEDPFPPLPPFLRVSKIFLSANCFLLLRVSVSPCLRGRFFFFLISVHPRSSAVSLCFAIPSHPFICGKSFPTNLLSSSTSSGHSGQLC